jgi:hypothetical protein
MVRIKAWLNVATMKHANSVWDWANKQHVRQPMNAGLKILPKVGIAIFWAI